MTPYATAADRARALYRIPSAPARNRTLEICHGREPLLPGQRWPGVGHAFVMTADDAARPALTFEPQSFDLVILHRTLDDLAAAAQPGAVFNVQGFLQQVSSLLTPGGLLAGCFQKRDALRSIVQLLRPHQSSAARSHWSTQALRRMLVGAGLSGIKTFGVLPDADSPLKLIDDDGSVSHFAFMREIAVRRRQLSLPAYAARRLAVELGLNRRMESAVFFWAYKPC